MCFKPEKIGEKICADTQMTLIMVRHTIIRLSLGLNLGLGLYLVSGLNQGLSLDLGLGQGLS